VQMKAFQDWCNGVDEEFNVKQIKIQSVDMFGPRVGFLKFDADVSDKDGQKIPAVVFMRGTFPRYPPTQVWVPRREVSHRDLSR